jgi:hypothetical protein
MAYGSMEPGDVIDPATMQHLLCVFASGDVDAAYLKQTLATDTPQGDELDEILETQPDMIMSLANAVVSAQWPLKVSSILWLGRIQIPEYDTPAKVRTALGLSN